MTYHLRRLRLHGIIERLPDTHRYQLTDFGWRTVLFCTRTYNRLLRPGLAQIIPPEAADDPALRRCFDELEAALEQWIDQENVAA